MTDEFLRAFDAIAERKRGEVFRIREPCEPDRSNPMCCDCGHFATFDGCRKRLPWEHPCISFRWPWQMQPNEPDDMPFDRENNEVTPF